MNEERNEGHREAQSWLGKFGHARDVVLIGVTLSYAFGYVVFAVNAAANNLGSLPAVKAQYLVAGVVPTGALLLYLWAYRPFRGIAGALADRIEADKRRVWSFFVVGLISLGYVAATWQAIQVFTLVSLLAVIASWCVIASMTGIVSGLVPSVRGWFNGRGLVVVAYVLTGYLLFLVWGYFVAGLYTRIPQAYGGVQPRCAYMDLDVDALSTETRSAIIGTRQESADATVARSAKLLVYFSTESFSMVRPDDRSSSEVFELKNEAIRAIAWCK